MTIPRPADAPVTIFGPDFPFAYDDWLQHPQGLATLPVHAHGTEVAIVGAGMAGMTAAYELMKLGLKPVIYEASRMGGRLRSQPFEGGQGVVAELGGMRFPASSTAFFHYVKLLGLQTRPFPNPLTPAAGSTVVDLEGQTHYARSLADLPPLFSEVAEAWSEALAELGFGDLQQALRERDVPRLKALWDRLVPLWDDRTFYDFIAQSDAFSRLSFRHREVFGQVGFGTGGWDSDFPNTMLEILRVVLTGCDEDQHSLASLHGGATRPGVTAIRRVKEGTASGQLALTDSWGTERTYPAVLVTCQSWLLTTQIAVEESLFSQKLWMALDRTRYMQSSKTFVMVDRPFWKDVDPATGRDTLSMTLTDRLTRGTYLFDNGPGRPAVMCLSYAWMSDALKMLPHPPAKRVQLALDALKKIYPTVDIAGHIVGDPITISWEADPYFLGAFKGALPGHYRYNQRMYGHFMQDGLPPAERGIFLAGDDVSFTPAWVEGAVQTSLNAVWGIVHQLGGRCAANNPGPGELYPMLGPVALPE
jgi:lysine 2-monooxygenase